MEDFDSFEPKFNKDSFFDYEKTTQNHNFETGFQILNKEIPDSNSEESIPPIEHYENITNNYDNGNFEELKKSLNDFSSYLYKNGFDDIEEFNQTRMEEILVSLCESKISDISQISFYIITLLQSKGPAYPDFCFSIDFFNFCKSFLNKPFSVVLYYCLSAIVNICYQNDEARNYITNQIPIEKIISIYRRQDINVKEIALDLACAYLKSPLSPESCLRILNFAKEALGADDKLDAEDEIVNEKLFHRSGFWILARILRSYPELTEEVMTNSVLASANTIFDDNDEESIIPGLIFISYVYEMNFEIPNFDYNGILEVFASPPTRICQIQAYKTLNKIFIRRPDLISKFIQHGLIVQSGFALENAKYVDKIPIGLLVCNAILYDVGFAADRVLQTKSISFFLDLIEYDDEELNKIALTCIVKIFDEAEIVGRVDELFGRFNKSDGLSAISKLENDEDNETSLMATNFRLKYFPENEEDINDNVDDIE